MRTSVVAKYVDGVKVVQFGVRLCRWRGCVDTAWPAADMVPALCFQ